MKEISNYVAVRELLNKMSGQQNVFTVPKIYVEFTGDLTTAILLNQIVFLSDKSKRTDGYFYKTYKEWQEEICLTKRQVSYSTKKLKEMGLVETKIKKANGSPTVHYKLDYDKLIHSLMTFCNYPKEQNVTMKNNNMSLSLTENTTENTTENIPYADIINYLNEKAEKRFKHTSRGSREKIKARWNEGHKLDDFKRVIDVCCERWKGKTFTNGKLGDDYLQPSTLFNNKFDERLNWTNKPNVAPKQQEQKSNSSDASDYLEGVEW